MRLFIAEKPDLAKAIVEGLGGGSRKDGYYDCGGDYVAWCYGHMLQLLDPEDYDVRYKTWCMDDLPISHIPWRKKPGGDDGSQKQLKVILGLLKKAASVVNAGDPDEEGQLLVDEILEYARCSLPVQRVLINNNTTAAVKKALAAMRPNADFAGLSAAADARSVGDQLYGYNLTRAYTLAARSKGYQGLMSVGRVQTPILGLVVRRTRAFNAHTKAYYYNVTGQFDVQGVTFPGRYQVAENDPVDEKGRLVDERHAKGVAEAASGKPARIVSAGTKAKEQHPPLPYNLLKLQTDAARKYGFKPDQTKDITQTLREKHKLITYNRSDCEYLNDELQPEAPAVLAAIGKTAPVLAAAAQRGDPAVKSRAFNSAKVSAHHGIIPTETMADLANLSDGEQRIYLLIARAYIAQFWPKHLYDQTDVVVEAGGHRFTVRANITTQPGWRVLYKNDAGNDDLDGDEGAVAIDVRSLRQDQAGLCTDAVAEKQETKPQPLYTMATLLSDLTRVAKYIRDERLRKLLLDKDKGKEGEHGGIGTPATRDSIIATLFDRSYLVEQGKSIVPTKTAEEFYDALPDQAKFPDMTALWHEQQKAIQAGERDTLSFVTELMGYVAGEVARVKEQGLVIQVDLQPCPTCAKPLLRLRKKGTQDFFWGCSGYADGCKYACEDKAGKPVPKAAVEVSTQHKCGICDRGLARRPSPKKKGAFWWSCSGYPECKQTYPDSKGRPDFSKAKTAA